MAFLASDCLFFLGQFSLDPGQNARGNWGRTGAFSREWCTSRSASGGHEKPFPCYAYGPRLKTWPLYLKKYHFGSLRGSPKSRAYPWISELSERGGVKPKKIVEVQRPTIWTMYTLKYWTKVSALFEKTDENISFFVKPAPLAKSGLFGSVPEACAL